MLQMIVAAISGEIVGAPGSITANWDNISFSSPFGDSQEKSSTVVFSGGGSRTLMFTHDAVLGRLFVKVDSGIYTAAPTGYSVEVTTGQEVWIEYTCFGESESATLVVTDADLAETVDTVSLTFTYTGL